MGDSILFEMSFEIIHDKFNPFSGHVSSKESNSPSDREMLSSLKK